MILQVIPIAVMFGIPISWIVMSSFGIPVTWTSFLTEMFLIRVVIDHNYTFWDLWDKWTGKDDQE